MKTCCNVSNVYNKYRKFKNPKKALHLPIVYNKYGHEYEKIFKKEESIERLKILGLINIKEEYKKIYNHV